MIKTLTSLFCCFLLTQGIAENVAKNAAKNTRINCDDIEPATEVQTGVFVRPSENGVIFEDNNIANIGFIVGDKEIAVIDSGGSVKEAQQLKCKIKKVSDLPIRYLINTHVHPDHTMGNSVFDNPNITFIGHHNLSHAIAILSKTYLRRYNEKSSEKLSEKSIFFPKKIVTDELEINLGNRILTLIAIQKSHTNNDLIVHDKKTDTLWLSDLLFHKHVPVIGKSGSVNGWLKVVQQLRDKGVKNIIPGHGPLKLNMDNVSDAQTRYLTLLRDEIRANISKDADLSHAIENIGLSESPKWEMFSHYHKRNVSYIFSELEWE